MLRFFFCAIIFALCLFDIFTIEEKYTLKRIIMNLLKNRNMELAWWISQASPQIIVWIPSMHMTKVRQVWQPPVILGLKQGNKSATKASWLYRPAKLGSFVFK